MLNVEFAQLSDPGVVRQHNEDRYGCVVPANEEEVRTHGWLFALADGVGGHDRGEVASTVAIEQILSGFRKAPRGETLTSLLPRLVQAANAQVYETGLNARPGGSSMATTVVTCAIRFDRTTVSHVGDSRCYLIRQGYAVSLTRDHTVSSEQLRMGLVTAREAAGSATSNVLSRTLGTGMFIGVETSEHQIFPDDMLLLCSDGLHHSLNSDDIASLAGTGDDLESAVHQLVTVAKQRDGSDNITVQLIRVRSVERVGMYRGRHYKIY